MMTLISRGWLALLCSAGLGMELAGCQQPCDSDLMCGETQTCNRITRRCEDKSFAGPAACAADGECAGGRVCVDGTCAFAAPCLDLRGSWELVDGRDGGRLGQVQASQAGCSLGFPAADGGARVDLATNGTVDRLGSVTGMQLKVPGPGGSTNLVNCTGTFGGNETLAIQCNPDAGGPVLHLYARPPTGLAPQPCAADSDCSSLGTTCLTNLAGIPACGL